MGVLADRGDGEKKDEIKIGGEVIRVGKNRG